MTTPADSSPPHDIRLFLFSLTSALAGFLFGFDTVVVAGAEDRIQDLWDLGDAAHGIAVSAALWGTVLGALLGGWPTDRVGRKATLLAIGVLYFISAVGSALAPGYFSFVAARFIGGLGVGASTIAGPLYISEISPPHLRGRLTGLFQFNIVFGILAAFGSNYLLGGIGNHAWRWMLGVEAVPALAYSLLCLKIPESPRWLLAVRRDKASAIVVLRELRPLATEASLSTMADEISEATAKTAPARPLREFLQHRRAIMLAIAIAFFNQMSGINAILYYSKRFFKLAGLDEHTALLQSVGLGVTNLVFTLFGLWLIDRAGRRQLLLFGSLGYIGSLGLCAWAFASETFAIVPFCIFAFIAAHAIGQGAVIWVFIAEIFPNRHRARGTSLGSATHWVLAALLTAFFPMAVSSLSVSSVLLFFCAMMAVQLLWVWLIVPETKGLALEDVHEQLQR